MKYEVLFETAGIGVFTRHDDEDAACRHIDLLIEMNGKKGARWSITHQGTELHSSKPKAN